MHGFPSEFWGKFASEPSPQWHPLSDHCADVAAVCEALLRHTLLGPRLAQLGGHSQFSEVQLQRLCALAAFHDAGKFNLGFQNKADPKRQPRCGHVQPLLALFGSDDTAEQRRLKEAMPLLEIASWAHDDNGLELLFAAIAHHGKPVGIGGNPNRQIWRAHGGRDPFAGIARFAVRVRQWFPAAFEAGGERLPSSPAFQHAFCGLVTLADWLGSDRLAFPFSADGAPERMAFARPQAATLLSENGLDPRAARAALRARPAVFAQLFDFQPNSNQRRMLELEPARNGGLAILESETGSGKTLAALAHFFRLFEAGTVDGMYFALPTRTAAFQMHQRIAAAVARALPDPATRPPVILAVPGYLPLEQRSAPGAPPILASPEVLWNDDEAERMRFRHWAAERPKRYLAGAVSVGTVDQALLSALAVAHSHLRATSLLRQLLVVNEVHASDAYMATVLREVLRFHLKAGGYALLLSATLGARAASLLTGAARPLARRPPAPLAQAEKAPYPALTTIVRGAEQTNVEALASKSPAKTVSVKIVDCADDFARAAGLAMEAAINGARVVVVRNTVADCVATQLALERSAAARNCEQVLFAVAGVAAPHHSRFAREDRLRLDRELEARLGKNSGETSSLPCVIAATQTVQQSLDLDADLMLTDLCPMDVMLQRIGRLHRHRRRRPDGFTQPQIVVLTPPERDLAPTLRGDGSARGAHGLGGVYDDLRIVEATWRLLEANPRLEIPAMNRRLVEQTTHPEALRAITQSLVQGCADPDAAKRAELWKKHERHGDGLSIAQAGLARLNLVERDKDFVDCQFPSTLERRIATRLGTNDRIVEFPSELPGPFSQPIRRLTIPGWLVRDAGPDSGAEDVRAQDGAIRFRFGAGVFIYDRLGLRPEQDSSQPSSDVEEDSSDG